MIIEGIDTTVSLQQQILADPDFIAGNLSTRFMERFSSSRPAAQGAAE
jgi:biotin carboxylase